MLSETNYRSAAAPWVEYRVYVLNEDNRIFGPAEYFAAVNDEAALEMATRILAGQIIELWDGTRLVRPTRDKARPQFQLNAPDAAASSLTSTLF